MNKCEWKDEKFEGCDNFNPVILSTVPTGDTIPSCKSCGTDIRKPEPVEPLVMKSGGTWAAHWKGIDYLWTLELEREPRFFETEENNNIIRHWKPFSEITLDDEIAKLRPMIGHPCREYLLKLYGINSLWKGDWTVLLYDSLDNKSLIVTLKNLRLATPHELEAE